MRYLIALIIFCISVLLMSCNTVEPVNTNGLYVGSIDGHEFTIEKTGRTSVICYEELELTFLDVYDSGEFIKSRRGDGSFEYTYTINGNTMSGNVSIVTAHYQINGQLTLVR